MELTGDSGGARGLQPSVPSMGCVQPPLVLQPVVWDNAGDALAADPARGWQHAAASCPASAATSAAVPTALPAASPARPRRAPTGAGGSPGPGSAEPPCAGSGTSLGEKGREGGGQGQQPKAWGHGVCGCSPGLTGDEVGHGGRGHEQSRLRPQSPRVLELQLCGETRHSWGAGAGRARGLGDPRGPGCPRSPAPGSPSRCSRVGGLQAGTPGCPSPPLTAGSPP